MTGNDDTLFVSDWDNGGTIKRITELNHHSPLVENIMSNVGTPMMLYYTSVTIAQGEDNVLDLFVKYQGPFSFLLNKQHLIVHV